MRRRTIILLVCLALAVGLAGGATAGIFSHVGDRSVAAASATPASAPAPATRSANPPVTNSPAFKESLTVTASLGVTDLALADRGYQLVSWDRSWSSDAHRFITDTTWLLPNGSPGWNDARVNLQDGQITTFDDEYETDWCSLDQQALPLTIALRAGNIALGMAMDHYGDYRPATDNGASTHGTITVFTGTYRISATCYHNDARNGAGPAGHLAGGDPHRYYPTTLTGGFCVRGGNRGTGGT